MTTRSTPRTKPARLRPCLVPWLVSERDLVRYLSRELRACLAGRVVLFLHRNIGRGTTVLLAIVRMPDDQGALAAAWESYQRGRVTRVRLQELPAIRRARQFDRIAQKPTSAR